jgi:hypothetical protein
MRSHGEIRDALYGFVMNELEPSEAEAVSLHLVSCADCRAAMEEIRELVAALPRPPERPSDAVDEQHWVELAQRIENALPATPVGAPLGSMRPRALSLSARIRAMIPTPYPGRALALAMLLAAILGALVLRPWEPGAPVTESKPLPEITGKDEDTLGSDVSSESAAEVAAHFRRSKSLLVGLTNRPVGAGAPADLTVEREASRRLLAENRRFRTEVIDPQSSEVLADLERIMIEVANARDQSPASDLDLIRQGIRQQNLLFKVRMAEQLSARGLVVRASGR